MDLNGFQILFGLNNIIFRGCEVKNIVWIVGVVVYVGGEIKVMFNSLGVQLKRSRLEEYMNREIGWLVVFFVIICFVGGLGMGFWVE